MMSILGISLMVGGVVLYGKLNGGFNDEPVFNENKTSSSSESIYNMTYDYLSNLTYEEIYSFIDYNDILRCRYKDDIYYNCDIKDKHQLCKYIANIAMAEKRPFNNKYINY